MANWNISLTVQQSQYVLVRENVSSHCASRYLFYTQRVSNGELKQRLRNSCTKIFHIRCTQKNFVRKLTVVEYRQYAILLWYLRGIKYQCTFVSSHAHVAFWYACIHKRTDPSHANTYKTDLRGSMRSWCPRTRAWNRVKRLSGPKKRLYRSISDSVMMLAFLQIHLNRQVYFPMKHSQVKRNISRGFSILDIVLCWLVRECSMCTRILTSEKRQKIVSIRASQARWNEYS